MVSDRERLGLAIVNIFVGILVAAYLFLELGAFIIVIGIWMGLFTVISILKSAF